MGSVPVGGDAVSSGGLGPVRFLALWSSEPVYICAVFVGGCLVVAVWRQALGRGVLSGLEDFFFPHPLFNYIYKCRFS